MRDIIRVLFPVMHTKKQVLSALEKKENFEITNKDLEKRFKFRFGFNRFNRWVVNQKRIHGWNVEVESGLDRYLSYGDPNKMCKLNDASLISLDMLEYLVFDFTCTTV